MPVGKAGDLRAESDRKRHNADAGQTPDEVVAHLMHENEQRKHQDEWHDIARQEAEYAGHAAHETISLDLISDTEQHAAQ
jgi:hypothetical protein